MGRGKEIREKIKSKRCYFGGKRNRGIGQINDDNFI